MNAPPASNAIPPVPPLITFEPHTRDIVLGSIKLVLKRLKKKGVVDEALEYQDLLRDPHAMLTFIQQFKESRDIAHDLAVDAQGKPVLDDNGDLICKVTLAQVERLLVYTCAKKVAAASDPSTAPKKGTTGGKSAAPGELPEAVKERMAFDWQLPLLPLYLQDLTDEHFRVLGPRLLLLRSAEAVGIVSRIEPADIRKAEQMMGPAFDAVLASRPRAIRGTALCNPKAFKALKGGVGKRMWDVLSADPQIVVELLGLSNDRIAVLAPFASELSVEAFRNIESVPDALLKPMLESFHQVFGDLAKALLGDEPFAKQFLFGMIGTVRSMPANSDKDIDRSAQTLTYKWESMRGPVLEWWESRSSR